MSTSRLHSVYREVLLLLLLLLAELVVFRIKRLTNSPPSVQREGLISNEPYVPLTSSKFGWNMCQSNND